LRNIASFIACLKACANRPLICEKNVLLVKDNNARIKSAIANEVVHTLVHSLSDSFFVWVEGLEILFKGHLDPSFITTQEM
jgi:hypothetical protein